MSLYGSPRKNCFFTTYKALFTHVTYFQISKLHDLVRQVSFSNLFTPQRVHWAANHSLRRLFDDFNIHLTTLRISYKHVWSPIQHTPLLSCNLFEKLIISVFHWITFHFWSPLTTYAVMMCLCVLVKSIDSLWYFEGKCNSEKNMCFDLYLPFETYARWERKG